MEEGSWEYESYMETYRSVTKMMPDYVWHQIQLTVDQQELDFRVAVRARKSETATDALPTWYNEKIRRLHSTLLLAACCGAGAHRREVGPKKPLLTRLFPR